MSDNMTRSNSDSSQSLDDDGGGDTPDVFRTRFEADPNAAVVAIVETVAAVTGHNVVDMPPLYETVDSEALSELVTAPKSGEQPIEVTFSYQDCRVAVSNRGTVAVAAPDH